MPTAKIVVGVDGSPPSVRALCWAAREAQRRGASLGVLVAYNCRTPAARLPIDAAFEEYVRDLAMAVVDAACGEARSIAPQADVGGTARCGDPAQVLVDAADGAQMLVVGSRGGGGFAKLLAGSVSVQVATRAPCPVAVVRGRDDNESDPVVVGVDGSASSDVATGVAFEEAARRDCPLLAVLAYNLSMPLWAMGPPPVAYDITEIQVELQAALVGHVAAWRDRFPDVPAEYVIGRGSPGAVLAGWSRHAQLAVVGSRGRGGTPPGPLIGSVGLQMIHHAECPVLIARFPDGRPLP
ncbi:universal stress protein [Planosporangium sp. 12N6]|uniref:universal stress protein n=1 Tax=Planosporangium spinosum TaxID=3402278 RepID=UPI003CF8D669